MEFKIEDRLIGDGHPAFIIAELSANHMNDYDIAVKTIEAMAKSGADAVKFQTYTPDCITSMRMHLCHGIGSLNWKR